MNLGDLFAAIARRWLLSLLVLALAVAAAVGTYMAVGPSYKSTATVVLMPPSSVVAQQANQDNVPANPLLYLGNLINTRDVVIAGLSGKDTADTWAKQYPNAQIVLAGDQTSSSPLIDVTVTAPTQAEATGATKMVLSTIPTNLTQTQNSLDIPDRNRISALTLSQDSTPAKVSKTQIEYTGMVGAAVLVLGLLLVGLLDGSRRRRRVRDDEADTVAHTATPVA